MPRRAGSQLELCPIIARERAVNQRLIAAAKTFGAQAHETIRKPLDDDGSEGDAGQR